MFNLYESRQPLIRRKRGFVVRADCQVELIFRAKSAEEAENLFNDYCEAVEYRHPELLLEVTGIREE